MVRMKSSYFKLWALSEKASSIQCSAIMLIAYANVSFLIRHNRNSAFLLKMWKSHILNLNSTYYLFVKDLLKTMCIPSLFYRQHSHRLEEPLLHRPVRTGAPETSGGQPPALCRPLLQGGQPHPEEWRRQAAAGSWCRHPSTGPAGSLCHRPGQAGHREGPSKEASANGKKAFVQPQFEGIWRLPAAEFSDTSLSHRDCDAVSFFFFVSAESCFTQTPSSSHDCI